MHADLMQPGLFDETRAEELTAYHLSQLGDWRPSPGDLVMVSAVGTRRESDGVRGFWYGERAAVVEERPGPKWVVEIAMGKVWGHAWSKDGTRLVLDPGEIAPWPFQPGEAAWEAL